MDSAANTVDEEHSQVEVTDDSCKIDFIEIVPLSKDTGDSCSSEFVSSDWSADVKQEDLANLKLEPDDVCCVIVDIHFIAVDEGRWSETDRGDTGRMLL